MYTVCVLTCLLYTASKETHSDADKTYSPLLHTAKETTQFTKREVYIFTYLITSHTITHNTYILRCSQLFLSS